MTAPALLRRRPLVHEAGKLAAFVRRDFLVALSYRMAFFTDALSLAMQVVVFSFMAKLVDPAVMPSFGGTRASYMGFVVAGIAVGALIQLGLNRATSALRNEQMAGTLELLFTTPTRPLTLLLGLVVYDLVYIPARTTLFLVLVMLWTDVNLELHQLGPALAVMMALAPTVWGIGVMAAGTMLTFRRGGSVLGFTAVLATFGSGAYFPVELLPGWVQPLTRWNPIAIALEGVREALLGGVGWEQALPRVAQLLPLGAVLLAIGIGVFRLALGRERRLGTLGQY